MSDLHAGSKGGLTPPGYWLQDDKGFDNETRAKRRVIRRIQQECWEWYESEAKRLNPIDVLEINGDAITGKERKTGGTELLTADRDEQVKIALRCIKVWRPRTILMTYGTGYHTGEEGEDWEDDLARELGAKIDGHIFFDVSGVVFNCKHHLGGSTVPHTRTTAISREDVWNTLWAERKLQPRSNILVRSHVHYFEYRGNAGALGVISPSLQAFSKLGRRFSGTIDYGFLQFDISERGDIAWQPRLAKLQSQKVPLLKL